MIEHKMKICNKCLKEKPSSKFLTAKKKTCKKCEYRLKQRFLRSLVHNRRLSATERLANRLGYMGSALMMTSPHLLPEPIGIKTYIMAGVLSLPQVIVAKQWNLVLVNLNVAIAYTILFFK
jgi:hypothetical protein